MKLYFLNIPTELTTVVKGIAVSDTGSVLIEYTSKHVIQHVEVAEHRVLSVPVVADDVSIHACSYEEYAKMFERKEGP